MSLFYKHDDMDFYHGMIGLLLLLYLHAYDNMDL
jgi:hypothetical protein